MTAAIKYIIKGQSTTIKKVAVGLCMIAVVLFITIDFLLAPLQSLPIELQVFAFIELIPRFLLELNFVAVILFFVGLTLYTLRWRNGIAKLSDNEITIGGPLSIELRIDRIEEINFIDSEYPFGIKRLIQIVTKEDVFKLRFKTDDMFTDFTGKLIAAIGPYKDVKIKTSILLKPIREDFN